MLCASQFEASCDVIRLSYVSVSTIRHKHDRSKTVFFASCFLFFFFQKKSEAAAQLRTPPHSAHHIHHIHILPFFLVLTQCDSLSCALNVTVMNSIKQDSTQPPRRPPPLRNATAKHRNKGQSAWALDSSRQLSAH